MTDPGQPDIQHSTGRSFATWGCGYIAYQAAMAAHREGRLARVTAPSFVPSEIPADLTRTVPVPDDLLRRLRVPYRVRVRFDLDVLVKDNIYDRRARKHILPGGIFHGWSHQALFSMRRAKAAGARLVLERPNTHPLHMSSLVTAEFRKYGFSGRVDAPFELAKSIKEIDLADRVVVCSEFARQSHLERGVPDEKLRVINYGVDTQAFTPGAKHDGVFRVVYCGIVFLRKGIQYLLQAWKELGLKDAELWIIGLVAPDTVKLLEGYGELPGLRILGHVNSRPELAELYRQGSVFVSPSVEDGFGMVVTEAMACGVPVVISGNTGARDVVEDGVNGYVIPTYDVNAIKDRILHLRAHPEQRETMGIAARATAENNTWLHYSQKLLRVYDELA